MAFCDWAAARCENKNGVNQQTRSRSSDRHDNNVNQCYNLCAIVYVSIALSVKRRFDSNYKGVAAPRCLFSWRKEIIVGYS